MNQETLKNLVEYKDGWLYWKERKGNDRFTKTFNSKFCGVKVGSLAVTGYLETAVKQEKYLVHRLVFLYHHGYLPEQIDHIDGNRLNNHIDNLRPATKSENQCNTCFQKNNLSGSLVKGVYRHGKNGWRVQIMKDGEVNYRGGFATREDAEVYAAKLRSELHGNFGRNV